MRHLSAVIFGLLVVLVAAPAPLAAPTPTPGAKRDRPVDKAIDRALESLFKTQERSGAWRLGGGPNPAITSLAVMAFLAAGHVPGEGPYGDCIEKGARWVLTMQKPSGLIATQANYEMYEHGISTLMLSEVAGMTEGQLSKDIRAAVSKAVLVILKAQRVGPISERGGWRYHMAHDQGSDISVTGWQIMALRAARNIGCDVPGESIAMAVDYIKRCQDPTVGGFRYQVNGAVTIPCTGTSILALELCGKNLHKSPEVIKAGNFLLKSLQGGNTRGKGGAHFFYMIYYCSQATFQLGDGYWSVFREELHRVLLTSQAADGSWNDPGNGNAYGTAMAVLALAVEYRFLPIYQRSEEPEPKDK